MEMVSRLNSVHSARGARITTLEWKGAATPASEDVARLTIGPSGYLRAPTVIAGGALLVGFSEELYRRLIA